MKGGTDWLTVWPFVAAAGAFGLVYTISLVAGASVEEVLVRATGAMLAVGLASLILRAVLLDALPDESAAPRPGEGTGSRVDIRLPEEAPATAERADGERRPPAAA
jgi:hypothetical protein